MNGLVVDLFAGGGGASTGIEAALGRAVDVAINHDPVALAAHKANHPRTRHLEADIWEVRPKDVVRGRPVGLLWASPDCTHFSVAKGGKPRDQGIRSLAWAVTRWAADVRPAVIMLENVSEFRTWGPLVDGRPDKTRMGITFRRWKSRLENLGYEVDHRILDASHYGAPTKRKRLFLIARCDGKPIRWPPQTHGGMGLEPLHTAAECIDWSIPCPSIFERKRPLAPKTLARIAAGIRRFVIDNPRPYVISIDHQRTGDTSASLESPLSTITTKARHALLSPTLVQTGYGERKGQRPRYLDIHQPLGTVVAGGSKAGLVPAFLAKHYGGHTTPGSSLANPMDTITARDHHALVTSNLVKLRRECAGADVAEPMPTVTAGGTHIAEVRAFLIAYYSSGGQLQDVGEPMRTITAKHRLGLVTVDGWIHQIADIGMRMLQPHELLRAQFGQFAADYDLSAATTQEDAVRLIGNSVCPEVAEALVAANIGEAGRRAA